MYYGGVAVNSTENDIAIVVAIACLLFVGIGMIGGIAEYVIRGLGMYKLGKIQEKENAWLAFVPFARTYFQGELSGNISLKKRTIKNPGVWLILLPVIYGVAAAVFYVVFWIVLAIDSIGMFFSRGNDITSADPSGAVGVFIFFIIIFALIATAFTAITKVLKVLVDCQIYERYTVKNMAVLHAVLGVLIPYYESICLFIFGRKAERELEERYADDPGQPTIE